MAGGGLTAYCTTDDPVSAENQKIVIVAGILLRNETNGTENLAIP